MDLWHPVLTAGRRGSSPDPHRVVLAVNGEFIVYCKSPDMSGGDSSAALGLGSCVLISALQAKPQHNGQHGVVEDVPDGSGRLIVRLEGTDTSLSLKPANLQKVCSGCKTPDVKLSACSRCKSAFFCGQGCLKANWPAHKKECGKQPWLGKAQSIAQQVEQEVADAMRAFDVAAAEPEDELVNRIQGFNEKMDEKARAGDNAGVIALRQQALWAFGHMREFYKRGQQGEEAWSRIGADSLAELAGNAADMWGHLGHAYIGVGQLDKARHAFETQLAFCAERKLDTLAVRAHEGLGALEAASNAPEKAAESFGRARDLCRAGGDKRGEHDVVKRLADMLEARGLYHRALAAQKELLLLVQELWSQAANESGDGSELAQRVLGDRAVAEAKAGTILLRMGQAEEALAVFERAREVIRTIKDPTRRSFYEKQVLQNSAVAAAHVGRHAQAKELWETVLVIAEASDDTGSLRSALMHLGVLHATLRDSEKAIEYHQRALAIAGPDSPTVLYNLAAAQLNQGLVEASIPNLRKAITVLDSRRGSKGVSDRCGSVRDDDDRRQLCQLTLTKALYSAHKTGTQYAEEEVVKEAETWLDIVLVASPACAVCQQAKGDNAAALLTCGQCGVARYCSVEHQKLHWRPKDAKAASEAVDFSDVDSLRAALREDPDLLPARRGDVSMINSVLPIVGQRGMDWHKRVCKLFKKWKSVKRGQASRGDARDLILAFLAEAELPVPTDDEGSTITLELCGRKVEIPWQGPPFDLQNESTFMLGTGQRAAMNTVSSIKLDATYEHVILCNPGNAVVDEIPVPMRYFEEDGVSTGLFEDLLGGVVPAGLLPGKGKRFTQENRSHFRAWISGGGAKGEEIRALGVAIMRKLHKEDGAFIDRLERLTDGGDWRGVVAMADEALKKTAAYEDIIGCPEAAVTSDVIYSQLGNAYRELKQYERAIAVYDKSLAGKTAMRLPDASVSLECVGSTLGNKGETLLACKRYREAILCYEQRLELFPRIDKLGPPFLDDERKRRKHHWRACDALSQCYNIENKWERSVHYCLRKLHLEELGIDLPPDMRSPPIPFNTNPGAPGWREYIWGDGVWVYYNPETAISQTLPPSGWRPVPAAEQAFVTGSRVRIKVQIFKCRRFF